MQTDKNKAGRRTDRRRGRQTGRHTDKQRHTAPARKKGKQTLTQRQADSPTYIHTGRQAKNTLPARQAEVHEAERSQIRHKEADRQTDRQRDRQAYRNTYR